MKEYSTQETTKDCSLVVRRLLELDEERIILSSLQTKTNNKEELAHDKQVEAATCVSSCIIEVFNPSSILTRWIRVQFCGIYAQLNSLLSQRYHLLCKLDALIIFCFLCRFIVLNILCSLQARIKVLLCNPECFFSLFLLLFPS